MEPSYSVVADWLSKFHTWPMLIQALWLVAMPVTVLGSIWLAMRGLRDIAALLRGPSASHGRLVYGLYEGDHGRLLLRHQGEGTADMDIFAEGANRLSRQRIP